MSIQVGCYVAWKTSPTNIIFGHVVGVHNDYAWIELKEFPNVFVTAKSNELFDLLGRPLTQ